MDIKKLEQGEVLSESQFYKVVKVKGDKVQLETDTGENIIVTSQYVENFLSSAKQHSSVVKLNRTELTDKFLSCPRVAMTVNFHKQAKPTDIKKAIVELYPNKGGKLMSEAEFAKKVSKAVNLKGEERTMTGRHYGGQDINGRVSFIDMEKEKGSKSDYDARKRLVDPRTLNWLIVGGVKYEVKK